MKFLFCYSLLRSSIECASSYTANCVELEDGGLPGERPGVETWMERAGKSDRMADQQYVYKIALKFEGLFPLWTLNGHKCQVGRFLGEVVF